MILQTRSKSQLIRETHRHLRMLKHMTEADGFHLIVWRVDVPVRVLDGRLSDKRRRVSCLGRTRMVGASVSALRLDVRDGAVLALVS